MIMFFIALLDFLISAILGFIHGSVLGYFVGALNIFMTMVLLFAFGYLVGDAGDKTPKKEAAADESDSNT